MPSATINGSALCAGSFKASVKTSIAFVLLPDAPNNSTTWPSGVTDVGNWLLGLTVRRSASPVPSAACQYKFGLPPPRVDVQITRLLSDVQMGLKSCAG